MFVNTAPLPFFMCIKWMLKNFGSLWTVQRFQVEFKTRCTHRVHMTSKCTFVAIGGGCGPSKGCAVAVGLHIEVDIIYEEIFMMSIDAEANRRCLILLNIWHDYTHYLHVQFFGDLFLNKFYNCNPWRLEVQGTFWHIIWCLQSFRNIAWKLKYMIISCHPIVSWYCYSAYRSGNNDPKMHAKVIGKMKKRAVLQLSTLSKTK